MKTFDPTQLATMNAADALVYADKIVADWPNGYSQLDRAAFEAITDEVRRQSDEITALRAARDGVRQVLADELDKDARAKLERIEALVPALQSQARALRENRGRSRISAAQAIAIEGVAQQIKLALGGDE